MQQYYFRQLNTWESQTVMFIAGTCDTKNTTGLFDHGGAYAVLVN